MIERFVWALNHYWAALLQKTLKRRASKRQQSFRSVSHVGSMAEADAPIQKGKLVIVGTRMTPKWLRFICPCGCGEIVALNLMRSHSPRWTISQSANGKLSVFPSIDSTTCHSHYWIRHNRIDWVYD